MPGEKPARPLSPGSEATQRLDLWLWHARVIARREDCAALVSGGLVRINRVPTDKPHAKVRVGDVLTVPLLSRVRVLTVLALAEKRGSPAQARELFAESLD